MPAVLHVEEIWDGRSGGLSVVGDGPDNRYDRQYVRVFDVITEDVHVGPLTIYLDDRIPQIGEYYTNGLDPYADYYEVDLGSFANSVNCECVGGAEGAGVAWRVTVQYQPWQPFSADPTERKIRVVFGGERTERVVDFDRHGNPIRNSATDRFGDPVTVDDHITTMTITRNELVVDFDPALASLFSDTINDAEWNGFAPGYCKMGIISTSEEKFDSNSQRWYYTVTYPVQVGRKPWRKDLLDQGFNELDPAYYANQRPRPIMNDGQPIADPVALDGAGRRLPVDGTPVTLSFDVFDETDWDQLNINMSLRLGL